MTRGKVLPVAAALLCLVLVPARWGFAAGVADREPARAVVISGHRGAVLAIGHDDARNLLFTAGADGTVRIWDPVARSLVKSITVTSLRAAMLAVSPAATQFAVLSTDSLQSFSLDVWDWQKEKRLFSLPLDDQPLFIRYSASGRYLLYSLPRWESLRIVNASDGSPVTFHPEGFGMVGFATLSRSEKILMTYRLTGQISYWDLASGKLLQGLTSVPLLSHIRLSPDLSFIVGNTDSDVCLVDVASGRVQARASLPDVTSLDISPTGDQVACIAEGGVLSRWRIAPGTLTREADAGSAPLRASVVSFAPGALILGAGGGDLTAVAADGSALSFPGDVRAVVTGMAVKGGAVALATSSWIKVFTAGLPDAARADGSHSVRSLQVDNPFQAPVGLTFLGNDSLLVWQNGDGPGAYAVFDISSRSFSSPGQPLGSPVVEAMADADRCLLLANDGTLRVLDLPSLATRVEIRRPGAMWATFASGSSIVVGGDAGDEQSGSLVRINISTGETDPIRTRDRHTYEISYDASANTLYSLGVEAGGTTNLTSHTGADYQNESVIESAQGEHLSADLAQDSATQALYSSLGHEQITRWRQGSLETLPASARGTARLLCGAGILYSLNQDSSVAFIDPEHGVSIAELSLFKDGGWALLMQDGKFAASAGSESRVSVLQDGKPVQDTGAYLVPVQIAESR